MTLSAEYNRVSLQKTADHLFLLRRLAALCKNNPGIVAALVNRTAKNGTLGAFDFLELINFQDGIESFFELIEDKLDAFGKFLPRANSDAEIKDPDALVLRLVNFTSSYERYSFPVIARIIDVFFGDGLNDVETTYQIKGYKAAHFFLKEAIKKMQDGTPYEEIIRPFLPENKDVVIEHYLVGGLIGMALTRS